MKTTIKIWQDAQKWEGEWWGDCVNTYGEEQKQFFYADKMGLKKLIKNGKPHFDIENKSVLDIGGGPTSLLLKCINRGNCLVVDPILIYTPDWTVDRYINAKIQYSVHSAEELESIGVQAMGYEEVWIYNVLQHTQDPQKIIENARKSAKLIRIFEWLDTPPHEGHPQTLRENELNTWLHGIGRVEQVAEKTSMNYGTAYYGIFPTDNYGEVAIQ